MKFPWRKQKWHTGGPVPVWKPNPVGNIGGEIVPDRFEHEYLVGYRSWHVVPQVKGVALKSLHMQHVWRNPETARCLPPPVISQTTHDRNDAPYPECSCGLYAQLPDESFDEWEPMRVGKVAVFGTIEMSGRIIICERGYKAQHARIVSGYFEVSCAKGGCVNPVVVVQPRGVGETVLCWCTAHEPVTDQNPVVDADLWLREAARLLAAGYDTRFFYWDE